ncbi:MAG: hypothetical protein JWO09_742 [Bacteroidetes bacterium]|nr:hypothetical protein [Bacteroidota bacterium]
MSNQEKIICLGKEFNSEEERREYYRTKLRSKLPELKKIEGFPIGEDEDIINLSDPPYYTACPNPWLNDFVAEWEKEKENYKDRKKEFHVEGPYAIDVIEGKNHPLYNAHSYHTKVPHAVIMRYLLHYTQPGDIIYDGFSGTGMSGVAAKSVNNPEIEFRLKIEKEWSELFESKPVWGKRNAIISDLSPIASFIGYNYNKGVDNSDFIDASTKILKEVEAEFGWMYQTKVGKSLYKINYIVWSDFIKCPNCNHALCYWDEGIDYDNNVVYEKFHCSKCNYLIHKDKLDKYQETIYDNSIKETIYRTKQMPVLINYSIGKKRYEKRPDEFDLDIIARINALEITSFIPSKRLPEGGETRRNDKHGFTHTHHFYTRRNLIILSSIFEKINKKPINGRLKLFLLNWFNSSQSRLTIFNRYAPNHNRHVGPLANTLYISYTPTEISPFYFVESKIKDNNLNLVDYSHFVQQISSATDLRNLSSDSIDYIFTDPPFGANIMYSELNAPLESWIKIFTNNKEEAIENKSQSKGKYEYQVLMEECFKEYYRVLKPGKWMTVEFSNTSAAIWNALNIALQKAGFVIASINALNKGRGGLHGIIGIIAVNQDLAISCYKPSSKFEETFISNSGDITVWDFLIEHLNHLPVHIKLDRRTTSILERSPKILFDRLITFYLMRGLPVPIDAKDFQEGLKQKFIERDGMYFTAEQAAEYDEKKAKSPNFVQLALIVTNESDAIEWLKDRLRKKKERYNEIMPDFRIATQSLRKGDTLPELQDILSESFIQEADGKWRTPDPNEAKDREALRIKVLLKEFTGYVTAINQPKAKKLKEVRVEALRAGFKNCWEQKDFKTIVILGDMIPQNILLEDEQLLMYYDIAKDRV